MPISKQFKIIFVHIPRVAGTSTEKYLGMGSLDQLFSFDKIKTTKWSDSFSDNSLAQLKTPQHLTALELKSVIPESVFSSFQKFSIVRNPLDRIISEYLHIQNTFQPYATQFKQMSLNDFVKKGLELPESERVYIFDGHLETQYSYLYDENGGLLVNKVFKLEEFNECKLFLKSLTGIENFPHARNMQQIQQTLSPASINLIKDFYKKDFETFDYN